MIELRHLTLNSKPLQSFAIEDTLEFNNFAKELIIEGDSILNSAGWKDHQIWHKGLVETWSLYPDSFKVLNEREEIGNDAVIVEKKSFWSGGGTVKSDKEKERDADKGFAYHMRKSIRTTDVKQGGYSYECYYDTLAINHAQQEIEYVTTLARVEKVVSEGRDGYLKMYNLPFPTTNRSFFAKVAVVSAPPTTNPINPSLPPLRSFYIFSLPISPHELTKDLDHGFVRGKYVSVEQISEIIIDGEIHIQWRLASMSTAAGTSSRYEKYSNILRNAIYNTDSLTNSFDNYPGSIPRQLSESHMQSSMASHVQPYLAWLARKYATLDDHPISTHHEKSKKRLSLDGIRRSLSGSRK